MSFFITPKNGVPQQNIWSESWRSGQGDGLWILDRG